MRNRILLPLAMVGATITSVLAAHLAIAHFSQAGGVPLRQPATSFQGIGTWLNSAPLKMEGLRGKGVLVDFWLYECIISTRHHPHVKAWHEKYGEQGLVVGSLHSPKTARERSTIKLEIAVRRMGMTHAVPQDNHFATCRAFGNQFWSTDGLIDRNGRLVHMHYGEGGYAATSRRTDSLLDEPAPES